MGGLGWQELLIIFAVALLLFGGTRLAGIGKAAGRSVREFKEETRDLKKDDKTPKQVGSGHDESTATTTVETVDPVEQNRQA